jgi:hypothetical protein
MLWLPQKWSKKERLLPAKEKKCGLTITQTCNLGHIPEETAIEIMQMESVENACKLG